MTLLPAGSASQQQSNNVESQTESSATGAHEEMQQAQEQFDNQQYSEADWVAYWQYYGKSSVAAEPAHAPAFESIMLYWQHGGYTSNSWCCRVYSTATTPATTATAVPQTHAVVGAAVC